jgi:hypothetical protein
MDERREPIGPHAVTPLRLGSPKNVLASMHPLKACAPRADADASAVPAGVPFAPA